MVSFTPITEADLPLVKKIYDYYILNTTATFHHKPLSIDEIQEFLFINHPKYISFMIRESGQIIGYCFITRFKNRPAYDRTAEISIYLQPEWRGKGIGTVTLAFLERTVKISGIHVLIMTLSAENIASIRLCEKMGYIRAAHLPHVGEKFGRILDVFLYVKEI